MQPTKESRLDFLLEQIMQMTPTQKKAFLKEIKDKVSANIYDELATICVLSDAKVQEAMFNKLWDEAHAA